MKKALTIAPLLAASLSVLPVQAQVFTDDDWEEKTLITAKWSPLYYELNIGANVVPDEEYADFIYFSVGYGKPSATNDWNKYLSSPTQGNTSGTQPTKPTQPTGPSGSSGSGPGGGPGGSGSPSEPSEPTMPTEPTAPAGANGGSMDGLHAGLLGLGWKHFFNHAIGFHVQAGWGFVADLGSGDDQQQQGGSGSGSSSSTSTKFGTNTGSQSSSSSSSSSSSNQEQPTKDTFVYNTVPVQVGLDVSLWNNLIVSVGATYMWKEKPMVTLGIGVTF